MMNSTLTSFGANGATAVTFVIILAVLVFFHELGHFGMAKLFKMRVEEFALGFGKRLFRVGFDGQTEYNIRAIPLGGFVRIAGMEIEDAAERRLTGAGGHDRVREETQTTNIALMEQEAVGAPGGQDPDGFSSRPLTQRFLVILAGPVFSVLLGWLAFCVVGAVYGLSVPTTRVAKVTPGFEAQKAGLRPGDVIRAVNGAPIADGEALIRKIRSSANTSLRFTVQDKEGVTRDVTVTPRLSDVDGNGKPVGFIGIAPGSTTKRIALSASFAEGNALTALWFKHMASIFRSGRAKDNLGGPIAIIQMTRQSVDAGGASPFLLLAQLSLSIGLFNLLPIPVLDGGHIALLTLEGIRGRKLTAEQTQRVLATGLAILAFLFVWVMFNDLTRIFRAG